MTVDAAFRRCRKLYISLVQCGAAMHLEGCMGSVVSHIAFIGVEENFASKFNMAIVEYNIARIKDAYNDTRTEPSEHMKVNYSFSLIM